jgi:uncharacterized RDD family membrane protein YckC
MSAAEALPEPRGFLVNRKSHIQIALQDETSLGREAGIQIDGVSRKHCVVKYEDGFFVADSNSRYGTYINRQRIVPNQWRAIKPGDTIMLGGFELQLIEAQASRATPEKPRLVHDSEVVREGSEEQTKTKPPQSEDEVPLATLATVPTRLAAVFIDSLLYFTLTFVGTLFLGRTSFVDAACYVLGMALVTFGPWILQGQSLGKMAMKIKVVNEDGTDLPVQKMFLRDLLLKHGFTIAAVPLMLFVPPLVLGLCIAAPTFIAWRYFADGLIYWDVYGHTRVIDV